MPRRLKDELSDILQEDILSEIRDNCGIAAAVNFSSASKHALHLAWALNHRGDKGFGAASVNDGQFHHLKKFGTVAEKIGSSFDYSRDLPGKSAVAHTRYPTMGFSEDYVCLQPLVVGDSKFGAFTISQNGQLVEGDIRQTLKQKGAILPSVSDSAIIPHIMSQVDSSSIIEGLSHFMRETPTAYSLIVQTPTQTIALRDRFGVKPLHYAKMEDGWLIASESDPFRSFIDAEYQGVVKPGEMIIFENEESNSTPLHKIQVCDNVPYMPCIFERIYFSEPRSKEEDVMHEVFRRACGMQIVAERMDEFSTLSQKNSVIIPILDSGKHGALGVHEKSRIPYEEYFMRRHNVPQVSGRSYTQSTDELRRRLAYAKLDLLEESVAGKDIITVDDSLVRSTTATIFNKRLNDAGAASITNIIVSPMVRDICFLGMNHQDINKLAAHKYQTEEAIARAVGADQVMYLSTEGLSTVAKDIYGLDTFCGGCFGMNYPVKKPCDDQLHLHM